MPTPTPGTPPSPRLHEPVELQDYEQYIGREAVDRIHRKGRALSHLRVVHLNSTFYGGGVAELLDSLSLMLNYAGVDTEWRTLQGARDFFSVTKKMHNALQSGTINLSDLKKNIYEDVIAKNARRTHLENYNRVVIHDPQPLPFICHYNKNGPWLWHCHVDLSDPNAELWAYLEQFVERYDAVIVSSDRYRRDLETPQRVIRPAIDPFTIKNKPMSDAEIRERLDHYDIPTDLPLVVQVSRFDRWKDPEGVIEAFKLASESVDARLVLLGAVAGDDPEGQEVYESLLDERSDRIIILSKEDTALVNALQRKARVVLQKSLREGFGLTVSEAMWKETPVIGGDVGGIPLQIDDGENGFLVSSIEEAADRIVQLVDNPELADQLGRRARQTVRDNFLMIRLLEDYLDLLGAFETRYHLRNS
jgi:trehalose synthase